MTTQAIQHICGATGIVTTNRGQKGRNALFIKKHRSFEKPAKANDVQKYVASFFSHKLKMFGFLRACSFAVASYGVLSHHNTRILWEYSFALAPCCS
jgi:hypothetical protein